MQVEKVTVGGTSQKIDSETIIGEHKAVLKEVCNCGRRGNFQNKIHR